MSSPKTGRTVGKVPELPFSSLRFFLVLYLVLFSFVFGSLILFQFLIASSSSVRRRRPVPVLQVPAGEEGVS